MRADKDANRQFYDTHRPGERERFQVEPSKLHTAELLVPWVVASLEPGARVLDVAGGAGTYASQIVRAAPGVSIAGVDISEAMVRQRAEDPLLAENVVGDMEALPFEAGSFDAVLFVACLHHVPDPLPALREAWRVLEPRGLLFAFEPCSIRAWRAGRLPVPDQPHEFCISVFWLAERIREAGFRIDEIRGRRLSSRLLHRVLRDPSVRLYRAADALDRVLTVVPGVERLASIGMLRATKA